MGNEPFGAIEMMLVQAAAVEAAARRLDLVAFGRAVELLHAVEGKVVTTGAGTSGIIARKIAATLTSTGTPSLFLHPGDALHGALGVVTGADVAIAVSNSGETDELLALLPHLEHRKVPIISLLGNTASTLGSRSEVVLDASAAREACPLDLAPTASTSVAMALGDALAMTVMAARGVTADGFALNHPSGRLGRRLTLRVGDLLDAGSHPAGGPDATWLDVIRAMTDGGRGAVTVEDADQRLLGIVTDGDVRRGLQRRGTASLDGLRADDLMSHNPVSVHVDLLASEALGIMENRPSQISVVPVVDESDRCIGLLRLHDLVRSGI